MKSHANPLGLPRTEIALKLLAHGPLSTVEFHAITGWKITQSTDTLCHLRKRGLLRRKYVNKRPVYMLPNAPYAECADVPA